MLWYKRPIYKAIGLLVQSGLRINKYLYSVTGKSQYQLGFEEAFALLKASTSGKSDETKKRVILFLTDGEPSDDDRNLIFKTIRDRNLELNNSVIIFTFGIGAVNQEILTDIAIQNTTKYDFPRNISVGDITVLYV